MRRLGFLILSALTFLAVCSCSEKEEVGEYDNWQERNQQFLDSIAGVCKANADGSWVRLRAFNLATNDSTELPSAYYIYVKKLATGEGDVAPLYTDSVRVHYSGRLIPTTEHPDGYVFGKSFSGKTVDESIDVPSLMGVRQNIVGFATALMRMHVGDRWIVYIPYYLGYGETAQSSGKIPAYSTLIFDINLVRIYKYGSDMNTDWY